LQEDIIKEAKKHSFYLKPGEKKRFKQVGTQTHSQENAAATNRGSLKLARGQQSRHGLPFGHLDPPIVGFPGSDDPFVFLAKHNRGNDSNIPTMGRAACADKINDFNPDGILRIDK
jgi:hypothetical protein